MIRYNVSVVDSSNEGDMQRFEELMTRSLNDDRIIIVKQETCFTKEGDYIIAVHWTEDGASDADKEMLTNLVKEKL